MVAGRRGVREGFSIVEDIYTFCDTVYSGEPFNKAAICTGPTPARQDAPIPGQGVPGARCFS